MRYLVIFALLGAVSASDLSGAPEESTDSTRVTCYCAQCPAGPRLTEEYLEGKFCAADAVVQIRLSHYPFEVESEAYNSPFPRGTFLDYNLPLWSLKGRVAKIYRTKDDTFVRGVDIVLRIQKRADCHVCETQIWRPGQYFVGDGVNEFNTFVSAEKAVRYVAFVSNLTYDETKNRYEGLVEQCPAMFRYMKESNEEAPNFLPPMLHSMLNEGDDRC